MSFYAVHVGRTTGVYETWEECAFQVNKYPGARHKKFVNLEEAQHFVREGTDFKTEQKLLQILFADELVANGSTKTTQLQSQPQPIQKYNAEIFLNKVGAVCSSTKTTSSRKRKLDLPNISQNFKSFKKNDGRCIRNSNRETFSECPVVYTDGACYKNGKRGSRAGYGVWWGDGHPLNLSCKLVGIQTNQRAEIAAVNAAIIQAREQKLPKILIKTDSMFVINCVTKWIHKWLKRDWTKVDGQPVIHKAEFMKMFENRKHVEVKFEHVRAHRGIYGNVQADRLAAAGLKLGRKTKRLKSSLNGNTSRKRKLDRANVSRSYKSFKKNDGSCIRNSNDETFSECPVVYTDGACYKNGKRGSRAGYGVWWGDGHPLNLSCKLDGIQTNQRAEIAAVNAAIIQAREQKLPKILIKTDSMFVIKCATRYIHTWLKRDWTKVDGQQVIHKAEFMQMRDNMKHVEVKFQHVRAHRGIYGNVQADRLAVAGRKLGRKKTKLKK